MVKKTRKKKQIKKKGYVHVAHLLKKIVSWVSFLLVTLFAILYIYDYCEPIATGKRATGSADFNQQTMVDIASSDPAISIPKGAEIPVLRSKEQEQIVHYAGYAVSFNPTYKVANWVAYELTIDEAKSKKHERKDKFLIDKQIIGGTADNGDYTRSGFDRGHLAPAGDMKWSEKAMKQSFYMTNICPQAPLLNRGLWKELEEQSRRWAIQDSVLLIATGPILSNSLKRLGKNRVAIPNVFYKVIIAPYGKKQKGIAFLFENRGYKQTKLKELAVPIDKIEQLTGIDFYPALPDDLERKLESSINLNDWVFN